MKIITNNGKIYRCLRASERVCDFGHWQYLYKGKWHEVLNFQIRGDLNKLHI